MIGKYILIDVVKIIGFYIILVYIFKNIIINLLCCCFSFDLVFYRYFIGMIGFRFFKKNVWYGKIKGGGENWRIILKVLDKSFFVINDII